MVIESSCLHPPCHLPLCHVGIHAPYPISLHFPPPRVPSRITPQGFVTARIMRTFVAACGLLVLACAAVATPTVPKLSQSWSGGCNTTMTLPFIGKQTMVVRDSC